MSRYIDSTNISKQISDIKKIVGSPDYEYTTGYFRALYDVENIIADTPAADVVEVKHGEWEVYFDGKELMCSSCKATFWDENGNGGTNYCPNCGAKMEGKKERKMRDRLIDILKKSGASFENALPEEIADHLLAEGVIVPKVKTGDKIYLLSASKTKLYEVTVTHLEVHENDIRIWGKTPQWQEAKWICSQADLENNEWVYLTREEAEKALAERKEK